VGETKEREQKEGRDRRDASRRARCRHMNGRPAQGGDGTTRLKRRNREKSRQGVHYRQHQEVFRGTSSVQLAARFVGGERPGTPRRGPGENVRGTPQTRAQKENDGTSTIAVIAVGV